MKIKISIVALCLTLAHVVVFSQECPGNKNREIYNKGKYAYEKKDYVSALKYLFAYRLINEGELKKCKNLLIQLDKAIVDSEDKLAKCNKKHVGGTIGGSAY
jgi:hypothetical protein